MLYGQETDFNRIKKFVVSLSVYFSVLGNKRLKKMCLGDECSFLVIPLTLTRSVKIWYILCKHYFLLLYITTKLSWQNNLFSLIFMYAIVSSTSTIVPETFFRIKIICQWFYLFLVIFKIKKLEPIKLKQVT